MKTEEALSGMLKENTGTHFLDSGGTNGRAWQRNIGREFEKEESSTVKFEGYGSSHPWINVTHNVYHWLKERVDYDEDANLALRVCQRYLRIKNFRENAKSSIWRPDPGREFENGDEPWGLELAQEFPEFFAKWKKRRDYGEREDCRICNGEGTVLDEPETTDGHVELLACAECKGRGYVHPELEPYEVGGIYREGDPVVLNTYNEQNLLSQDLQFVYFELEDRSSWIVLQSHNGADARGGYTDCQVFNCDGGNLGELAIFDYSKATIYCTEQGRSPQLSLIDDPEEKWSHSYYTDDGGSHWYHSEASQATQLQKYGVVSIDPETYAELEESCDSTEGDHPATLIDSEHREFSKGWVKGKLCIDEDGKGYCPICGGLLKASSY